MLKKIIQEVFEIIVLLIGMTTILWFIMSFGLNIEN